VEVVAHARGDVVQRFHGRADLGALGQRLPRVGQHRSPACFSIDDLGSRYGNSSKRTFLYRVRLPVLEIEMPPFLGQRDEPFGLHRVRSNRGRSRSAGVPPVVGMCPLRKFIITARHPRDAARSQLVQGQVNGAPRLCREPPAGSAT
jgi:hypothetical protein